MKPRERFVTALNCGTPDRVPVFDFLFSPKLQKEFLGDTTPLYDGAAQVKLSSKLGLDGVWIPVGGYCGVESELHKKGEKFKDEWGVTYIKEGWPIMAQMETPIKSRKDWEEYTMPSPQALRKTKMLEDAIAANDDEIAIVAGFLGPFTMMTWYMMDFTTLSINLFEDPDLIEEMCDAYVDWVIKSAEIVRNTCDIDAFCISDDWGGTTGLLISPDFFRKFFLKPFEKIVKGLKEHNVPVIMHNDGKLWEILDDLVDTGINAIHPVEKAAGMDLAKVKKRYKGKICPIGNVNNKTTMVHGSAEDVRREATECLQEAALGGGYILATDHSLHDGISTENILAYIEVAKKNGIYPLEF